MPNSQKRKPEETSDCDISNKKSKTVCVFCLSSENDEIQYGEILTTDELTCHYFCLLLAGGLYQNAKPNEKSSIRGFLLNDIRSEVRRGFRLKCFYCQEKGATLGCCAKKCKKAFHLTCGRANGSLHQFFGGFGSYCDDHSPKQSFNNKCEITDDLSCSICLCPLDEALSSINILHSPCCNNSWFHRNCIQQYAISAGKHHFKCPLCNCSKKFLDEMQHFGVYIPDQDASWERQSGAFNELLERHNRCDADTCTCPSGRNHDAETGKYNLLLCSCCGSFGSHRTCRGLVWYESSLMCPFCAHIEKEFVEPERKARLKEAMTSPRTSNSQSEASTSSAMQENVIHLEMADDDEDIDIGGDLHVPPFLRKSLSRKIVRRALALPSCSLVLQKVDEVIDIPENSVILTQIPGFTYYRKKGHLIRNIAGLKKMRRILERTNATRKNGQIAHNSTSEIHEEWNRDVGNEEHSEKKATYIKQFDGEIGSQEQTIISCVNKRKCTKMARGSKGIKYTPHRRLRSNKLMSKVHTSPLSSLKKQKALKFLMTFNQTAQKQKRLYQKRKMSPIMSMNPISLSGSEKKLVQSTLMFFKSSSNSSSSQCIKAKDLLTTTLCKKGNKTDEELDNTSISITPHKRRSKMGDKENDNIPVGTMMDSRHVTGERQPDCASTKARPHKRRTAAFKGDVHSKMSHKKGLRPDKGKCLSTRIKTLKRGAKSSFTFTAKGDTPGGKIFDLDEEKTKASTVIKHHKKAANEEKDSKDVISSAVTPCKERLTEKEINGASFQRKGDSGEMSSEKISNIDGENNDSSIATTPHLRMAKARKDFKDDISSAVLSCKKKLNLDENENWVDNVSIVNSPHRSGAKSGLAAKSFSSPGGRAGEKVMDINGENEDESIATTPHMRTAKVQKDFKDEFSPAVLYCEKNLDMDEKGMHDAFIVNSPLRGRTTSCLPTNNVSASGGRVGERVMDTGVDNKDTPIATTPHMRTAKVQKDSKDGMSPVVSSCKKILKLDEKGIDLLLVSPHRSGAKSSQIARGVSSFRGRADKKVMDDDDRENDTSIATTPHMRTAKVQKDNMSPAVSSCKKILKLDEKDCLVISPHRSGAKSSQIAKGVSSFGGRADEKVMDDNRVNIATSIATPHMRTAKAQKNGMSPAVSSCKKKLYVGESELVEYFIS